MSPSQTDASKPKHSTTCTACRLRRVRCDRQKPCGACVQRLVGDECDTPLHPSSLYHQHGQSLRNEIDRVQRLHELLSSLPTETDRKRPTHHRHRSAVDLGSELGKPNHNHRRAHTVSVDVAHLVNGGAQAEVDCAALRPSPPATLAPPPNPFTTPPQISPYGNSWSCEKQAPAGSLSLPSSGSSSRFTGTPSAPTTPHSGAGLGFDWTSLPYNAAALDPQALMAALATLPSVGGGGDCWGPPQPEVPTYMSGLTSAWLS